MEIKADVAMEQLEFGRQLKKPQGDLGIITAEKMNQTNRLLYELAFSMLDFEDNKKLLEIGFGNGKFIRKYFDVNSTLSITGLDFSDTMYSEAVENNKDLVEKGKVKLILGNAICMPFDAESFDFAVTLNTIYFWTPLEKYLSEISRVLKAGGRLLIGYRPKESMENFAFTKEEFCLYIPDEIRNVIKSSGFRCIEEKISEDVRKTIDGTVIKSTDICVLAEKVR